jgi:hypothetical protein
MVNRWFEERKDLFFKELVHTFLESKVFFDQLYQHYRVQKAVLFEHMEYWIGSEIKKGPLWTLKDTSHMLFRQSGSKLTLSEYLFDWTVGSIFHEAMKLKEDAYQMETYKPLLEQANCQHNAVLARIVRDYFEVIEDARKNLVIEIERINQLFSKALLHLIEILPLHRENILLVRYLLENTKQLSEKVFGKKAFSQILRVMFPHGLVSAYLCVAEKCIQSGWYRDAARYLKKSLRLDAANTRAIELLQLVEQELI